MGMTMVGVGVVPMNVREHDVDVCVGVAFQRRSSIRVRMLVVHIVDVLMRVLIGFMRVQVTMPLGEMQPHAHSHQRTGDQQLGCYRLLQHQNTQQRAEERRHREVGSCSRCAQVPQHDDEQHQAGAVAEEAQQCGGA